MLRVAEERGVEGRGREAVWNLNDFLWWLVVMERENGKGKMIVRSKKHQGIEPEGGDNSRCLSGLRCRIE